MSETEFDLVIKVKYGDTLRRFTAYVHGNSIDIDISGLREKIINLFNLTPDTDFALTYTDEDNDVVSLVDNDDLRDAAVIQHLNPLRINVLLKTDRTFDTRSQRGTSTPVISPQIRTPLPRIGASVEEALKSVPEPLQSTLLKLSHNLMSKAASTPALVELREYFSFLGEPRPSPPSKGDGVPSRIPTSVSRNAMDLNVTVGQESFGDQVINSKVFANAKLVDQSTGNKLKEHDGGNTTRGVGSSHPPANASLDLNMEFSRDQRVDNLKDLCPSQVPEPQNPFTPTFSGSSDVLDGEKNKQPSKGVGPSVSEVVVFSPQSNCPVNGQMEEDLADAVPPGGFYHGYPYKRSHINYTMFRTFHKGVQCDGCGMYPIMGPRFKSKVKEDYDLCNICFSEVGNEADYTKIDKTINLPPRLFKGIHDPHPRFQRSLLHGIRGCGRKPGIAKLESRFIQDVTVLDGTLMAPATPFIKIWRMCNNGTVAWPSGTQLMWIGGDKLGNKGSVELEIPGSDCPVNKELDIAVDFIAPSQPGQYISYWRMASPSGQRFGQRIWVLIQVDNSRHDSLPGSFHSSLNLNLPPESNGQKGHGIIDVNAEPIPRDGVRSEKSNATPEIVKPLLVDEGPSKSQELEFQVVDGVLTGNGVAQPIPEASVPVSYPIIDFSEPPHPPPTTVNGVAQPITEISYPVSYPIIDFLKLPPPPPPPPTAVYEIAQPNPAASAPASYPIIDFSDAPPTPPTADVASSSSAGVPENLDELTLLKELEEMGFWHHELNNEILRKNEYAMEKSLDDLCDHAEWDPILKELQEMGFADRQMNKKLLMKNGGSIKRVVLDLIAAENEEKLVKISK